MSERPVLKLKLPKTKGGTIANGAKDKPTNPGTGTKLMLKFGGSKAAATSSAVNDVEAARPSPKIVFKAKGKGGKKRGPEDDGGAGKDPASVSTPKRIKLTSKSTPKTPGTPFIRLKAKGKPPVKPMGIGYDSEASDAEEDPHIEEEFILRMQPGDDCDYVRNAIETKNWKPVSAGGADIKMKFLRSDGRRAVLVVRGKMYAASMVDLPCIVEGMKSWDKKGWWKTADISQMLLVLGAVKSEEEALTHPLPEGDVKKNTFIYEHGLTPPMRWVRKRRFRKRVSTNIVMQVEQEVEDLFKRDSEAISSEIQIQTLDEIEEEQRQQQELLAAEEDYFEDAEGEIDDGVDFEGEFEQAHAEDADEWAALMEEAEEEESQTTTPAPNAGEVPNGIMDSEAPTPGITAIIDATDEAETPVAQPDEESGSDADEDDDDVEDEEDEEELENKRKREEIEDLRKAIANKKSELNTISKPILIKRLNDSIQQLQEQLRLAKAQLGEEDNDEDDDEE